jgi:HicB family
MSNLRLRLPDSLHRKLREIAEKDDVSINQFIATAVAEKAAAYLTLDYLTERAGRADPSLFDRLLARVPDADPAPGDELPQPAVSAKKRRLRVVLRRKGARRS